MNIVLVSVAANEDDAERFREMLRVNGRPGDSCIYPIVNLQRGRLAEIGNTYLYAATGSKEVFGLCHADVTFGPGALEAFTECAAAGNVCGIVGRSIEGIYRWCGVHESSGAKGLPPNPGPVSTLDCCSVFFRADLGLRFDEATFDNFHCHVEDLCLQAAARGIPIVVPRADASHPLMPSRGRAWSEQYLVYRKRLTEKWKGTRFETT